MRISRIVIAALAAHLIPVVAWAAFKPVRVLAPELLGLHCANSGVCVDDVQRLVEAERLRRDAVAFVSSKVGKIDHLPRTIFCSTMACSKAFGFTSNGGYNVGTFGTAISYRGWKPYFVRHELIHHLQNERLGTLNAWLLKPKWWTEGMAYSLSEDPRSPLAQPLQGWRDAFEQWRVSIGEKNIWLAAQSLNEYQDGGTLKPSLVNHAGDQAAH
ncbi:MAG TPA: hypothetical protein VFW93_03765 [Aquabacterium sp.]|uniref:hypothetical protein n=1 Tax=Aquabacterium sp. TaxID=1872578 RepID=UPI002E31C83B|nr:hypothetical protein [Aquabacterium sp.]HEX5355309.1 hypothetical protein [Aquabacterium sp.]